MPVRKKSGSRKKPSKLLQRSQPGPPHKMMTQQAEQISAVYNSDTDVMFPLRVIPQLRNLRGDVWKRIIDEVTSDNANLICQAAFILMMVKLGGCQGCSVDSFRG